MKAIHTIAGSFLLYSTILCALHTADSDPSAALASIKADSLRPGFERSAIVIMQQFQELSTEEQLKLNPSSHVAFHIFMEKLIERRKECEENALPSAISPQLSSLINYAGQEVINKQFGSSKQLPLQASDLLRLDEQASGSDINQAYCTVASLENIELLPLSLIKQLTKAFVKNIQQLHTDAQPAGFGQSMLEMVQIFDATSTPYLHSLNPREPSLYCIFQEQLLSWRMYCKQASLPIKLSPFERLVLDTYGNKLLNESYLNEEKKLSVPTSSLLALTDIATIPHLHHLNNMLGTKNNSVALCGHLKSAIRDAACVILRNLMVNIQNLHQRTKQAVAFTTPETMVRIISLLHNPDEDRIRLLYDREPSHAERYLLVNEALYCLIDKLRSITQVIDPLMKKLGMQEPPEAKYAKKLYRKLEADDYQDELCYLGLYSKNIIS